MGQQDTLDHRRGPRGQQDTLDHRVITTQSWAGVSLLSSYVASGRLAGAVRCEVQPNSTLMALVPVSGAPVHTWPPAHCREQALQEKMLCGRDVARWTGTLCLRSPGQMLKQHPRGPGATFTLRCTPQLPS